MKHGFIKPRIVTKGDKAHYVLGTIPAEELQPDGQWDDFTPAFESQNPFGWDTYNCTGFGTTTAPEMLIHRKYGRIENYSDRALGIAAGTWPPGNDPHVVAEAVRKIGLIPEEELPFDSTVKSVADYYLNRIFPNGLVKSGKRFLERYTFMHEWLWEVQIGIDEKQARMMEALKLSPLGASVQAWSKGERYYEKRGADNHWIVVYGYKKGKYWKIFDSDDNTEPHKKLAWGYDFGYAKRYHIEEGPLQAKLTLLTRLAEAYRKLIELMKQKKALGFLGMKTLADYLKPKAYELPKVTPPPAPKYDWSTPAKARHSVRVICDEEGLTLSEKNLITACIRQESEFKNWVKCENRDAEGRLLSTDWGICQINDYWHVGKGKTFPSVKYIVENPDKCVRWMISMYRKGLLRLWVSYSSGAYKKYL